MTEYYRENKHFLSSEVMFTLGLYLLLTLFFALARLALLLRNADLAVPVPLAVIAMSFIVGLRFDIAVSSYLLIPFLFATVLPTIRVRAWLVVVFCALADLLLFLVLAEAEFYREFENRFNTLVFEYLNHPGIVGGMIWEGYPVIHYTLVWIVLAALFSYGVLWLHKLTFRHPGRAEPAGKARSLKAIGPVVMLVLMVFGTRGGFGHEPLRWGDAYFSESTFANHLALNGIFTLGRSAWDKLFGHQSYWVKALPEEDAFDTTRKILLVPGETDLHDDGRPILRYETRLPSLPALNSAGSKPLNVVVILMESFAGRFVGVLGAKEGLTPEFDQLCEKGVLFERAFSNGTHTHQGVYASLASFPHLPGYDYLMKMMEANQEFSSLPGLLKREGYQTAFFYNGLFSWDNKEGFFRRQGVDRFIGTKDFINPTFVDPVWGVSDHDVFTRANEEFKAMVSRGPFLGIVLTLSNHAPFNLPDPLPFERIRTGDSMEGRFNGIRYSDWALGEFFRQASNEQYFKDTLFIITGDHGFGVPPMITEMQLTRFHVPLLFYSKALAGLEGKKLQTVASQVDITPSILGLLGMDSPHQCWGRNLFSPGLYDDGFALLKPSGGEERVALVSGDCVLVKTPKSKPHLYRYSLGSSPLCTSVLAEKEQLRVQEMSNKLHAYTEAAIIALKRSMLAISPDARGTRKCTEARRRLMAWQPGSNKH